MSLSPVEVSWLWLLDRSGVIISPGPEVTVLQRLRDGGLVDWQAGEGWTVTDEGRALLPGLPPPAPPRPSWARTGPRVAWVCGVLAHIHHRGDMEAGWVRWHRLSETEKAAWTEAAAQMLKGNY